MKLTAKKLKELIKEEFNAMKEENNSSVNVKAVIEKGMNSIKPEEYQKALEDPKTQEALAKIASKLGLDGLNEESDEEYAGRKDEARLKAKISDAVQMSAGASAIFAINALGVGGATLVATAGVGALVGLLAWYLGGWGSSHDAYKYSKLVNPEAGEYEERTYDPMDNVVKRK